MIPLLPNLIVFSLIVGGLAMICWQAVKMADRIERMHKLALAANASTGITFQKTDKTEPTKTT